MGFSQLSPLSLGLTKVHESEHVVDDLRRRIHVPTRERPLAAHSYGRREHRSLIDRQFHRLELPLQFQLGHRDRWLQDGLGFIFWEENESAEHVFVRLQPKGINICWSAIYGTQGSHLVITGTENKLGIWVGIQNPLDDLTLWQQGNKDQGTSFPTWR